MTSITPVHVLMIDDDENDALLVGGMLRKIPDSKFAFRWTPTFNEGLEQLQESPWDLCLVDYQIGNHTGIDVLEEAKRRQLNSNFVLLTGHGSRERDLTAMQAGAVGYLEKNQLQPEMLERAVRYAIANGVRRAGLEAAPPPLPPPLARSGPIPQVAAELIHASFGKGNSCVAIPLILDRYNLLRDRLGGWAVEQVMATLTAHLRQRLSASDMLFECQGPALMVLSFGTAPDDIRHYLSLVLAERLSTFVTRPSRTALVPMTTRWNTLCSTEFPHAEALLEALEKFFAAHGVAAA